MKALTILLILTLTAAGAVHAAVSVDANNTPVKDAFDSIAKQSSTQVLVDSDVTGTVSAVVKDVTADQAMDIVAKSVKAEWKKIQFPVAADTVINMDKLKAAVTALAALDVPGLSIVDHTSGKATVFAKAQAGDVSTAVKLPQGQTWKTFYLVSMPASAKAKASANTTASAAGANDQQPVDPVASERLSKIAAMSTEQRQAYIQGEFKGEMQLAPDVRVQMWRDRMQTMRQMMQDPTTRDQIVADMRAAGMRGFGGGRRNRGNGGGGGGQSGGAN